jgi:tRNA pseudouridine13 synthase
VSPAATEASQTEAFLVRQAESFDVHVLARAWGGPAGHGLIRVSPEDFRVDEQLGFETEGEGEHLFVHVEKRGLNTPDVAGLLSKVTGVPPMAVSYAGLKDRWAVTRQWFSVHLPGKSDPNLSEMESEQIRVLATSRHSRKLRRGALRGNRFRLVVREFAGDPALAEQRLDRIARHGFPNYFGEQRFGRRNSNLVLAVRLFSGKRRMKRAQRGLCLSAARSLLFNELLSARIVAGTWNRPLDGEVFQLDSARSLFREERTDDVLNLRCDALEIHPTAPLWGRDGRLQALGEALAAELAVLDAFLFWRQGLERAGVEADRRPLRAVAEGLEWNRDGPNWELCFALGRGSYATSLLREWLDVSAIGGEAAK